LKTNDDKQEFYNKCSSILGIDHVYSIPAIRRNRWNKRRLGNGRYPGFGLIQCFGSYVRIMSKQGTKMFTTYDETYEYLQQLVDKQQESVYIDIIYRIKEKTL
jgi:hypothetical protein